MFKRLSFIALTVSIFTGCSDPKAQENALLDTVKQAHDKVMADDGNIMKNKMQLKSLVASTVPGVKDSAGRYSKMLDSADNVMMGWMNKFNPDFTGKSHDEIMKYLTKQRQQVLKIDSGLKIVVASSGNFIAKNKDK